MGQQDNTQYIFAYKPLAAHEILDALENISDDEDDHRDRMICILPPPVDPDCPTDENSGEEDNVTLNNLPRNILLQSAEVAVHGEDPIRDNEEVHIKGKPIRYGFKNWVGATRLGYVLWVEPYQGITTMCDPK